MKLKKFALNTLITLGIAVFSKSAIAASDREMIPYLLAAAEEYIIPKLSRDLEKNVQVKSDPYNPLGLELVISNGTCDDYAVAGGVLGSNLYGLDYFVSRLEEDKSLTAQKLKEEISKPLSTFSFIQAASGVLVQSIFVNPSVQVRCGSYTPSPKAKNKPISLANDLKKRDDKLKAEGRY